MKHSVSDHKHIYNLIANLRRPRAISNFSLNELHLLSPTHIKGTPGKPIFKVQCQSRGITTGVKYWPLMPKDWPSFVNIRCLISTSFANVRVWLGTKLLSLKMKRLELGMEYKQTLCVHRSGVKIYLEEKQQQNVALSATTKFIKKQLLRFLGSNWTTCTFEIGDPDVILVTSRSR